MTGRRPSDGEPIRWMAACILVAAFFIFQVTTLDYGTVINNTGAIPGYRVGAGVVADSSLERTIVIGENQTRESLDLWMTRFKLYSVDADEVYNIMALARIKPGQGQFDPHYYQYGTAWLYPLGAWYFALAKLGVVPVAPLDVLLAEPDRMDAVYVWGRLFVLLATCGAALILYRVLRFVGSPSAALLGTAIFLAAPATVMFSQTLKPHWYALLWSNGVLLAMADGWQRRRFGLVHELGLALGLGVAVGASSPFAIFAILVWVALVIGWRRRIVGFVPLLRVPILAVAVCLATNPFLILNRAAVQAESAKTVGWFGPSLGLTAQADFFINSVAIGFGVGLTVLFLLLAVWQSIRPSRPWLRGLAWAALGPCLFMGALTANMGFWHINFRYVPYALPLALVLAVAGLGRWKTPALAGVLVLTVLQMLPLKLAYWDENHPDRGTRLAAARWIDAMVPDGSGLCLGTPTPAPYDVPPLTFPRYRINAADCERRVIVEREPDHISELAGHDVEARFRPRFSPQGFPLVFSHVNPQITVYRRIRDGR